MRRLIALFLLACILLVACDSGQNEDYTEKISFLDAKDIVFDDTEETAEGWVFADVDYEITQNEIELVSENSEVATIEHDYSALNGYFYCKIRSVGEGETYVYAKIKDSDTVSEKIKITVSIPDDGIENEDAKNKNTKMSLIYLKSPVKRGRTATIKVKSRPNMEHLIHVYYSSGVSNAAGLLPKSSDSDGFVEWSWTVGAGVAPGVYKIAVSAVDETAYYYFAVR
ncbi:MAG: hypothetical protein IKA74_02370 [Clostridia bacterium]|nr:hypothetical protein [Clostridia bacterium]